MKISPYRLVPLVALLFTACGPTGPGEITESRELFEDEREIILDASDQDRFRFAAQMMPSASAPATQQPEQTEGELSGPPAVQYDKPETWAEAPSAPMRDLNFTMGENGEGEVYLSRLPGTGGGLLANLNRWRGQMGLEDIDETAAANLPKLSLFGLPSTYLDLTGSYSGMGGGEGKANYGMLGVILSTPQGAVFVKATGPRPLIDAEKANFEAFVQSLNFGR